MDGVLIGAKLVGLLAALVVVGVVLYICLLLMWGIGRSYPWAVPCALPMVAAYVWAGYASSPALGWRLVIAVTVQVISLLIVKVVAG